MTLSWQKRPVLQGVSLQAAPGGIIAVAGHNGAGKTTSSRALCGLHKEAAGICRWNGTPQTPKARMKRTCMVMQDVNYQLFAESAAAECTFGLKDPDAALAERTLAALIRRLAAAGRVVFVVTHDYEFVCRTCTRVLHLSDGGIRDDLTVSEETAPALRKIFDVR